MKDIKQLYKSLSSFSVLRSLLEKPLFVHFFEYCRQQNQFDRLSAYGAFVCNVYNNGANLTDYVLTMLYEDENIYVKLASQGEKINANIQKEVERELSVLSAFSSLTAEDFYSEIGTDIPAFDSYEADVKGLYAKRLELIGQYGYGIFASNAMFSVSDSGEIVPVVSADTITLDSFVGYENERRRVLANTEAFISGRPAANVLLYGDAGTGKSSTVKAVVNHLFDRGVRLIELRKNQLLLLPKIMGEISKNPLKFIIFIDDLSFNSNDDQFSMLKATLEGSASAKAKNAVIYATSNRRHIVKESFADREGSDIHRNDTVQENLSLSERFGLTVLFAKPEKRLYLEIVHELALRNGIVTDMAELDRAAEEFALRRGYRSARCAEQFIHSLM